MRSSRVRWCGGRGTRPPNSCAFSNCSKNCTGSLMRYTRNSSSATFQALSETEGLAPAPNVRMELSEKYGSSSSWLRPGAASISSMRTRRHFMMFFSKKATLPGRPLQRRDAEISAELNATGGAVVEWARKPEKNAPTNGVMAAWKATLRCIDEQSTSCGEVSGELLRRRRRGGMCWETWGEGRVSGADDFDAEARRHGGRCGEAAGKSKAESAEAAEIWRLRSAAGATVGGWGERHDGKSTSCGEVSGEKSKGKPVGSGFAGSMSGCAITYDSPRNIFQR